jgi:tryptophan synthase beta subunit
VAAVIERAPAMKKNEVIVINLSGRGDKDVAQVSQIVHL